MRQVNTKMACPSLGRSGWIPYAIIRLKLLSARSTFFTSRLEKVTAFRSAINSGCRQLSACRHCGMFALGKNYIYLPPEMQRYFETHRQGIKQVMHLASSFSWTDKNGQVQTLSRENSSLLKYKVVFFLKRSLTGLKSRSSDYSLVDLILANHLECPPRRRLSFPFVKLFSLEWADIHPAWCSSRCTSVRWLGQHARIPTHGSYLLGYRVVQFSKVSSAEGAKPSTFK